MKDEKHWWQSETVWGGIAAIIAGVVGLTTQQQVELTTATVSISSGVAGLMAIHGRHRATKRIK